MRMSTTLFAYIARQFFYAVAGVFATLLAVIFLFDVIELMRRASGKEQVTIWVILQMATFKLPKMEQEVMPFAVLFGSMFAFWRLTRSNELVVARAAGISVWQFLLPALSIAGAIGIIQVGLFSPISSVLLARFERMEGVFFRGQVSALSVSSTGLWLRQGDNAGQAVIHATRMDQTTNELQTVVVFLYQGKDKFVGRLDAATGSLRNGFWLLERVLVSLPDHRPLRGHLRVADRPDDRAHPGQLRIARHDVVLGPARVHQHAGEGRVLGAPPPPALPRPASPCRCCCAPWC